MRPRPIYSLTVWRPTNKTIPVNCKYCDKEFDVFLSKYETAQKKFNGNLYCSRKCSRKNQKPFYQDFYWCHQCKWVRQKLAILREKGTKIWVGQKYKYCLKKDRWYCPHCDGLLTVKQPRKYQSTTNRND